MKIDDFTCILWKHLISCVAEIPYGRKDKLAWDPIILGLKLDKVASNVVAI